MQRKKKALHTNYKCSLLWLLMRPNQSILKKISPEYIHWKDWCSSWNSNTLTTWCKELTHWKRPWWWERLKAGGEGDDRGWVGWMVSLTQWTWVWAGSGSWWWTGKSGVLVHAVAKSRSQMSDWTKLNEMIVREALSLFLMKV